MGQKVHPYGFRLGYNKPWRSRWFADRDYADLLHEDVKLRRELKSRLKSAGISGIDIERAASLETPTWNGEALEEIARADLSIHLAGARRGSVPESEEMPIVELQCDIALGMAKRCLLWIAPGTGSAPVRRPLSAHARP